MFRLPVLLVSTAAWFSALSAGGQTIPAGTHDVPPLVVGDNESIGSNTTLNIYQNGAVGQNFSAGLVPAGGQTNHNLFVNLAGGTIGNGFIARNGAVVNVSAGSVGSYATAGFGSHLRLTGGTIGYGFQVYGGSVEVDGGEIDSFVNVYGGGELSVISGDGGTVDQLSGNSTLNVSGGEVRTRNTLFGTINVSGGKIASRIVTGQGAKLNITGGELIEAIIYYQSTVNISGGKIGPGLDLVNGSSLTMTGGIIENNFYVATNAPVRLAGGVVGDGIEVRVYDGSQRIVLAGSDFRLDGVPIANLASDGDQLAFDLPSGGVLTGVYPDGTPFVYSSLEGDTLPAGSLLFEQASLVGAYPTTVSLPTDSAPQGVHAGQTLNVLTGAAVGPHLMAGWGSTVNVDGGQLGYDFEAAGAVVNVSGGSVGNTFDMFHGSTLNVSGGILGESGRLHGAALDMTGGVVGSSLNASGNSTLQWAGGAIGDRLTLDASSQLTVVGGDFCLDGVPIAGLNLPGDTVPLTLPNAVVLSGILADGTPFAVTTQDGDVLPSGALMLQQSALPPIGPATLDAAVDEVGQGIRTGQTLVVGEGSQIPAHFNMAPGSQLNVTGGAVDRNLEATAATVNLSSGMINYEFDAYQGTVLTMTGGQLGPGASLDNGSQLLQSGGVSSSLTASRGSMVQVSGGSAGSITANQGSQFTLSGGELGQLTLSESQGVITGGLSGALTLGLASSLEWSGGRVTTINAASSTASVIIDGAEFYLDGAVVGGVNMPGDEVLLQVPAGAVLSGLLADGTTIAIGNQLRNNDRLPGNQVTLRYSAPPSPSASTIQVPGDPAPTSARNGQTLRVDQGGAVGNHVTAGNGSHVEVYTGGKIGNSFEAVGAEVVVRGGEIGNQLDVFAGATLTMLSGKIGVGGGSNGVQVLGGTLDLFGGEVASALIVENGGTLNVFGYDFTLAGIPIAGLLPGESLAIARRDGAALAGKLADGTPFDFYLQQTTGRQFDVFSLNSTVTLTLMEPATLPGDFNNDGSVDGRDFLIWQRGESLIPFSEFELAVWQANYGASLNLTTASTSIPEPATYLGIVLIGLVSIICHRR